jgi:hypothetical protein
MKPRCPDRGEGAILMALLRKLNPVKNPSRFTDEYWSRLHAEFRVHQGVAEAICILGLIAGLFGPLYFIRSFQPWDIGLGFGLMVLAPLSYISALGLNKGVAKTWQGYADYSTMMYGLPWKAQCYWLLLPALVLGAICLYGRIAYPIAGTLSFH